MVIKSIPINPPNYAILSKLPLQQCPFYFCNLQEKTYYFESSKGLCFPSFQRIKTAVTLLDDRLVIEKNPSRLNTLPVIMLDELVSVKLGWKISGNYIGYAIVAVLCVFAFPPIALLSILFIYLGFNSKIMLYTRSGASAIIYSRDKQNAHQFKEDMDRIANTKAISPEGSDFVNKYYSTAPKNSGD